MVNRGERSGKCSRAWVECINPAHGWLMWWQEKDQDAGWKTSRTQLHHPDAWIIVRLQLFHVLNARN